jgi:hypothetical protein
MRKPNENQMECEEQPIQMGAHKSVCASCHLVLRRSALSTYPVYLRELFRPLRGLNGGFEKRTESFGAAEVGNGATAPQLFSSHVGPAPISPMLLAFQFWSRYTSKDYLNYMGRRLECICMLLGTGSRQ